MRTKSLLITAVLGAATIIATSAQVTSVNAVGYVNKKLGSGFSLITNPLNNGENMLSMLIPTAADNSQVFVFRNGAYMNSSYLGVLGGWTQDLAIPVGEGFFFNNSGDEITVTFVGEVLQGADTNKTVPMGLSIHGSLVPQAGALGADLMFPGADGDVVYTWNGTGWATANFLTALGGWTTDPMLMIGDAVFVDKKAAGDWNRNFVIE